MAEPMTMNRVIHAAVRRDLQRLADALDAAPDGDRERALDLQRAYANLHGQLKHHHEQEDQHVFPALRTLGIDTALLEDMDGEHHAMSDALETMATAMQRYAETGSAADAVAARDSVEAGRAVIERHLAHEEGELEPLMQPHLESPEWKQAEKALRKAPPTTLGVFFAWLTDGMDPESRTCVRSTVPQPVVAVLSRVFGRRYHREVAPVWRATTP
jgi:hemerythrin-like domain-containing protein